jgi:hypothetical protein
VKLATPGTQTERTTAERKMKLPESCSRLAAEKKSALETQNFPLNAARSAFAEGLPISQHPPKNPIGRQLDLPGKLGIDWHRPVFHFRKFECSSPKVGSESWNDHSDFVSFSLLNQT